MHGTLTRPEPAVLAPHNLTHVVRCQHAGCPRPYAVETEDGLSFGDAVGMIYRQEWLDAVSLERLDRTAGTIVDVSRDAAQAVVDLAEADEADLGDSARAFVEAHLGWRVETQFARDPDLPKRDPNAEHRPSARQLGVGAR